MNYVDFIKALRCCSEPWVDDRCPCEDCPVPNERRGVETHETCYDYIMRLAADRLEEITQNWNRGFRGKTNKGLREGGKEKQ